MQFIEMLPTALRAKGSMTWIRFLKKYEEELKSRGLRLTNKNREKLWEQWAKNKKIVTLDDLFTKSYYETMIDLIDLDMWKKK